jgi:hypothetical protein
VPFMAHQRPLEDITIFVILFWTEFDMTGNDLKLGRKQKGWTQKEAARRLSVSQPYLLLWRRKRDQCPRN